MSAADRQLSLRLEEGRDPALVRKMRAFGRKAKKAAEKVTGKKPIEGFVDRVLAGEVQGWAFDPNQPARRMHITARHEGEIIAETLADLPRKDLTRDRKGDGKHGFNLRIPASFLDGSPRKVRIEAASGRTKVLLRRGEITVAASRPTAARKPKPVTSPGGPSGALEGVANGLLLGWAAQPKSGGAPAVVDVYDDERYLGSATADRPRPRREDEPKGARSFSFRLPEAADEAMLGRIRARITGTQVDLRPLRPLAAPAAPAAALERRPTAVAAPEPRVALLVFGSEDEEPLKRTLRSWSEQSWPHVTIGRVAREGGGGDTVFGPGDAARLRAFAAEADTLVVLRAGETAHGELARTLLADQPLADVLTWDRDGEPWRRSEAWPLAIELGQRLGGGYALRLRGLGNLIDGLAKAATEGERALELSLARAGLRWGTLPAALSSGPAEAGLAPEAPRQPRAVDAVSLALTGPWDRAAEATIAEAVAALPGLRVELLAPASAPHEVLDRLPERAEARLSLKRVDLPSSAGEGAIIRRLTEAATGEVVLLCRSGLSLTAGSDLTMLASWAMSPLAGAVTAPVRLADATIAGLTVAHGRKGWRGAPAAAVEGCAPVLAAPSCLMAVSRAKLAAVGGVDAHRFPRGGADIDLCLRLRRMGWNSLALSGPEARLEAPQGIFEASDAFAGFDRAELAAAAYAYPAARRGGEA